MVTSFVGYIGKSSLPSSVGNRVDLKPGTTGEHRNVTFKQGTSIMVLLGTAKTLQVSNF